MFCTANRTPPQQTDVWGGGKTGSQRRETTLRRRVAIFVFLAANRMSVSRTQQRFRDITNTKRQNIAWVVYLNVKPFSNNFLLTASNAPIQLPLLTPSTET